MMAAEWGLPPNEIEERVPALWVYRWLADREAQSDAKPTEIQQDAVNVGGIRRQRII